MKVHMSGRKVLAAVAVAGALSTTLAFTASNTVPASNAGSGSGAISGYTVSAVDYNLVSADPTKLTSVTFKLNGNVAASYDTKIQLSTGGIWFDCTEGTYDATTALTPATCTFAAGSEPTVASATNLTVVVAQ
jgi:hypothetical protein